MMACLNAMPIRAGLDVHLCNDFARAGLEVYNLRNNSGSDYTVGILWSTRIDRRRYIRTNSNRRYASSSSASKTLCYVGTATTYGSSAFTVRNYRVSIGALSGTHLQVLDIFQSVWQYITIPTTTSPISGIQTFLASIDSTNGAVWAQVNENVFTGSYGGVYGNSTTGLTSHNPGFGNTSEIILFSRALTENESIILSRYLRYRRMS